MASILENLPDGAKIRTMRSKAIASSISSGAHAEHRAPGLRTFGRFRLRRGSRRRSSLLNRRKRRHHALGRKRRDQFGADAHFRLEREGPAMQLDQVFRDRQAQAGTLLGGFDRVRALAELGHDDVDLILRDARSGSLTLMYCPPDAVQPHLSQISPPGGVNFTAFDNKLRQTCRTAR